MEFCLLSRISQSSRQIEKYLNCQIALYQIDVLPKHFSFFEILMANDGEIFFGELLAKWEKSKSTLSKIIARYVLLGYVVKRESSKDRRLVVIELTPTGVDVAQNIKLIQAELSQFIQTVFTSSELNDLQVKLEKIELETKNRLNKTNDN